MFLEQISRFLLMRTRLLITNGFWIGKLFAHLDSRCNRQISIYLSMRCSGVDRSRQSAYLMTASMCHIVCSQAGIVRIDRAKDQR